MSAAPPASQVASLIRRRYVCGGVLCAQVMRLRYYVCPLSALSHCLLVTPGAPTAATAAVNICRPSGFTDRFLRTLVSFPWRRFECSSEVPEILRMSAELHPRTWILLFLEDGGGRQC